MKANFKLNRKKYIELKKMDHGEMAEFINEVYNKGYEDGKKENEPLTSESIKAAIIEIKGIGEGKAAAIADALSLKMGE